MSRSADTLAFMASCSQFPDGFQVPARQWHSVWRYRALASLAALLVFAVNACGAVPVITSSGSASGTLGTAFSYQIAASSSPQSYTAIGLPAGISVNTVTGLISGTPAQTGAFNSTISATNGDGTGSASLLISVQTVVAWPRQAIPSTLSGVSAIAGGQGHGLALKSDGTVVAWGGNSSGQSNVPVGLNTVVAVACGDSYSLALRSNGTVVGWGSNASGQSTPPGVLTTAVAIAAGYNHSLALKSDGTVVAWGLDSYNRTVVPPGLNNVVAIAAGSNHSLALRSDGTVVGWGATFTSQAIIPNGLNNVVAIAAGANHSLALKSDGTVVGWGSNGFGQATAPAGLNDAVAIACGDNHSLVLRSNGTVIAWGYNGSGQASVPANLTNVVAIGNARGDFSLALTGNDSVASPPVIISRLRALGGFYPFQYRIVAKNGPTSFAAAGLPAGLAVNASTGVVAGTPSQHGTFNITISATNANATTSATLVLTVLPPQAPVIASPLIANATIGFPFSYQIGATNLPTSYGASGLPSGLSINTANGLISGTPTQPGSFNVTVTATNTSGTGSATLVIFPQTLIGWGSNSENETKIPFGLTDIIAIDADSYSSLALKADGTVVAWGYNDFNKGVVPAGLKNVVAISNGSGHSLALRSDGTVAAWGSNVWGQSTVPAGLSNVVAISAGWLHSLALKSDGTIVAWGDRSYPMPAGLRDIVAIAAGKDHSVALKADGTVVSWGYLNETGAGIVPTGLNSVVAIASGENHTLALKSDGTVVAWGSNWAGQTAVPSGLSNVVAISAGDVHSMVLRSDGSVVAWGAVNASYLGVGQATVPPGLANVVAIAAGDVHSLALIGKESTTAAPVIISPLKTLGAFHPFQYRIVAKNAPARYDATGLPDGLSLNTATGLISGTPTQGGTFKTVISATNANGTASVNLAITILSPWPVDGTLTLLPNLPVAPGGALVASTSGWRDPDGPLTYQFLLDDVVLGPPSSATTVNLIAPAAAGTHVLKVRVSDALGNFTESALNFIVNNAPVARALTVHPKNGPGGFTSIDVASLISDVDGDELTIASVTQGTYGAVIFDGTLLTFGPAAASFTGNDVFTYTISDGRGGVATGNIALQNALPIAFNDLVHPSTGVITLDVLQLGRADVDPDGDALLITAVTNGTHGTTSTDGVTVTYTPRAGYEGNDVFTYTISDGRGGAATASVRLSNALPIAAADIIVTNGEPVTMDPRLNDADTDNDSLRITAVTQGRNGAVINGSSTITYTPGPQFFGRDTFTYTVSDATGSATATVTVRGSKPVALAGPTTGEQVPEQPEGVVFKSFGLSTKEVFSGKLQGLTGKATRAVFSKSGIVLLATGSDAPGLTGATMIALGEPSGDAVIATLRGPGISAANKRALIVRLSNGDLRIGIREGDLLPSGLKVKRFLAMDGNGNSVFLLAKLGGVGVTPATDVALLALGPDGVVMMLTREGNVVEGQQIAVLASLVSAPGTAAEARWRSDDNTIGVRLTFSGGKQALYTIPTTASGPKDWVAWAETGDLLTDTTQVRSFGLPGFGTDGVAFTVQLEPTSDEQVSTMNDTAVLRATSSGWTQLAREGDLATGFDGVEVAGVRYKKFGDPIAGPNGSTAFAATLQGEGVTSSNRSGLWLGESDGTVRELARAGSPAPGGGRWAAFESLVFPDGPQSGPIFTAKLALDAQENVTRKTCLGLWALNSAGRLQLLLRTGDSVSVNAGTQVIKSFVALAGASGSLGTARGYDDDRHVTVIATFADGAQAVVNIAVP